MRDEVLVIGAGAAGLCAAYSLEKLKIPYRVIDKAPIVGSTWANLYPSLQLNTLSLNSYLPGDPTLWRYGFYPKGKQYYQYLRQYAEKHNFNITLGVTVEHVAPMRDASENIIGWRVESSEGTDDYRQVIIASGRFNNPYMPHIEGQESFTGQLIHASHVSDTEAFSNKRVMVVGSGPSGGDIAAALAENAVKPVLLAIRSDVLLARKYPLGVPHSFWQYMIAPLPAKIRIPLSNFLVYRGYPNMKSLPIKFAPNRLQRIGSSAPIRGRELYEALKNGGVVGVAGLARIAGGCAELSDGTRHEVDVIIMSTGYNPAVQYLDITFARDPEGWMIRAVDPIFGAEGMQVDGYNGLYLVGRFYRGYGALHNFRHEARIAAQQIKRARGH